MRAAEQRMPLLTIGLRVRAAAAAFSAATAIALTTIGAHAQAQNGILAEWVEEDLFNEQGKIALGYAVPIPVDTPLPFDGFRSYAGLRTRHMDLATSTPWVHPEAIGTTRQGRTIWAYRLGDADRTTPWGLPEPAMLTNGGIHAREWQTPETVTGILELMATAPADEYLYDYLRDQVNMVVIPVLNVDGFVQTQRTPALNYLFTDPDNPAAWPRDGRMRRKNMLNADEDLGSISDHLNGVDLNRNNAPYWDSTGGTRSSGNPQSLIHHGAFPQSEPETQALDSAANLGPAERLRVYTDVHSFSMVHFWSRTDNERLARQTEFVLDTFTDHHRAFPAGKWYAFSDRNSLPSNQGIGTTDEYFTVNYQVPSWTLEIEPSNGQAFHAPLPGAGADYGGAGENGHSGFILPEAEIRRVREELAQSFATVYYRQSGPPHLQSARLFDADSGALLYASDWDPAEGGQRQQHVQQLQALEIGRDYLLWLGFSKPMRWLDQGQVAAFPGRSTDTLTTSISARVAGSDVALSLGEEMIPLQAGGAPEGFSRYRTDAVLTTLRISDTAANRDLFATDATLTLSLRTRDMTGMSLDANPATVADWANGHWVRYEDGTGQEGDAGGPDEFLGLQVSAEPQSAPFTLEPGIAAAWFDPERNGEGFLLEVLSGDRAVLYWFTYDSEGRQDWYLASGTVDGNRLRFPELLRVSGGEFGAGFDPELVVREPVGSATFLWSGCDNGTMDWHIGNERGRMKLARLTRIQGLPCGRALGDPAQSDPDRPVTEAARFSGSWYDPDRSGEGFVVQILDDGRAIAYWFTYDLQGQRRWFFGTGTPDSENSSWRFDTLNSSAGGRFGDDFDPDQVNLDSWGTLELDLACSGGEARYSSTEAGFGSGSITLQQLTSMDGPACPDVNRAEHSAKLRAHQLTSRSTP